MVLLICWCCHPTCGRRTPYVASVGLRKNITPPYTSVFQRSALLINIVILKFHTTPIQENHKLVMLANYVLKVLGVDNHASPPPNKHLTHFSAYATNCHTVIYFFVGVILCRPIRKHSQIYSCSFGYSREFLH